LKRGCNTLRMALAGALLAAILLIQPATTMAADNYTLPRSTVTYLEHNKKEAQKIFEKDCTRCHSAETALSRRTYQDWLLGITYRHGKSKGWLPEQDAKEIFFHLIVHLEPELKQLVAAKHLVIVKNWTILLCTISGLLTFLLLCLTLLFAHNQKLRRRWFGAHRNFAKATLVVALFHGGLCFYLFVLR